MRSVFLLSLLSISSPGLVSCKASPKNSQADDMAVTPQVTKSISNMVISVKKAEATAEEEMPLYGTFDVTYQVVPSYYSNHVLAFLHYQDKGIDDAPNVPLDVMDCENDEAAKTCHVHCYKDYDAPIFLRLYSDKDPNIFGDVRFDFKPRILAHHIGLTITSGSPLVFYDNCEHTLGTLESPSTIGDLTYAFAQSFKDAIQEDLHELARESVVKQAQETEGSGSGYSGLEDADAEIWFHNPYSALQMLSSFTALFVYSIHDVHGFDRMMSKKVDATGLEEAKLKALFNEESPVFRITYSLGGVAQDPVEVSFPMEAPELIELTANQTGILI